MDPVNNPFSPGAGSPPPELVGRDPVLETARILFGRIKHGRPEKSLLLTGLRGAGKTVLLNEIQRLAVRSGYHTIAIEAQEDKPLGVLLVEPLRSLFYELERVAGAGNKAKVGLRVLRSFIDAVKLTVGDIAVGLDIEPEKGAADSGDLKFDLANVFAALGEAAAERQSAIALLIDGLQYFSQKELSALIMAMYRIRQQRLPLVLIGAGLPVLPGLAGEPKSYAERVFSFPDIGALSEADATRALREPAQAQGVSFNANTLREIYHLTHGYPYFLQEWGYQAWNFAEKSPITLRTVHATTTTVTQRLDKNFFRVRFDRLPPSEKNFLRAMAELGSGPHRTGDVAAALNVRITNLGPVRARLIRKGMIYSPAYGDMAFTVPLFDEFMKRAIPTIGR